MDIFNLDFYIVGLHNLLPEINKFRVAKMFCRRNNSDALLQYLYKERKLHLIPVAVGTSVSDLLILKPEEEVWPVSLEDVFSAPRETLVKEISVECADVDLRLSGKLEAENVIGMLHGIAASFGVSASAKLALAFGNAKALRVRARSVTADTLSIGATGRFMVSAMMRQDQGVYSSNDEIYMVREVLRAKEIEVVAFDDNDRILEVSAEATGLADSRLALRARNEHDDSVVFSSTIPAAFAVRLVRVVPDPPGWKIQGVEKAIIYRGDDELDDEAADAFIGDLETGPLALNLRSIKVVS